MRPTHSPASIFHHKRRKHTKIYVVGRKFDGRLCKIAQMLGRTPPGRHNADKLLVGKAVVHCAQGCRLIGIGCNQKCHVEMVLIGIIIQREGDIDVGFFLSRRVPTMPAAIPSAHHWLVRRVTELSLDSNQRHCIHIRLMASLLTVVPWKISGTKYNLLNSLGVPLCNQFAQLPQVQPFQVWLT